MSIINTSLKILFSRNYKQIEQFKAEPFGKQKEWLTYLVDHCKETEYGKKYSFSQIKTRSDFKKALPIIQYEDITSYIDSMMQGKPNVLWPGRINWFSKSSGTISNRSKFIPISHQNLKQCHLKGGHDAMAIWFNYFPNSKLFDGARSLVTGGSLEALSEKGMYAGDISAIMLKNMPFYAKYHFIPEMDIALHDDWEFKLEAIAKSSIGQNITNISGVPTWILLLLRKIKEISGQDSLKNVFPNLELYAHGGVDFRPYQSQFDELLTGLPTRFWNNYNASEGFFGIQYRPESKDMLLLLDNGVYYEFIPLSQIKNVNPDVLSIEEVEMGTDYALCITTNSGLFRYLIGDTIQFTSTNPFLFKITGRTASCINVFGEELMVWNTDEAIQRTAEIHQAQIREYHVAPQYLSGESAGRHDWAIEFEREPKDLDQFSEDLDQCLQDINSDYAAKRFKGLALEKLNVYSLPKGRFHTWLRKERRLGAQVKINRLSNTRIFMDQLLSY